MYSDDDIIISAAVCILLSKMKKKSGKRRCWVRPTLLEREKFGGLPLIESLKKDDCLLDGHLCNFIRISSSDIEFLLKKVEPIIQKCDTNWRKAIKAKERLLLTLRFLATGDSYHSLMYLFKISKQSISSIIPEVCEAISRVLQEEVKIPSISEEWKSVASDFNIKWNFPQCLGVMDGKHIAVQSPVKSGSEFFNYKGHFSVVLFAIVNANYEAMYFNVGAQGRISDGGIFQSTNFKKLLENSKLNLPTSSPLPGREKPVPYVFLGDDAFPLSSNLLKPYPGCQEKGSIQRIFNYRLCRARRISENFFGILSARFRVLRKPMLTEPQKVEKIVSACIYLHNYLKRSSSSRNIYSPSGTVDTEDKDTGAIVSGSWRQNVTDTMFINLKKVARKSGEEAKNIRDEYAEFFTTNLGRVTWQEKY